MFLIRGLMAFSLGLGLSWARAESSSALCVVNTTASAFEVSGSGAAAIEPFVGAKLAGGGSLCANIRASGHRAADSLFTIALNGGGRSISLHGDQREATTASPRWATPPGAPIGVFHTSGFTGHSEMTADGATREDAVNAFFINAARPPDLSDWMSRLDRKLTLSRIVMPGAHDAGMYKASACATGVAPEWTLTQYSDANSPTRRAMSIGRQLEAGVRYFDMRLYLPGNTIPAGVTLDHFFQGHFTRVAFLTLGCFGASMGDMARDVERFLDAHPKETVMLAFSHTQAAYEPAGMTVMGDACGAGSSAPKMVCENGFGSRVAPGAPLDARRVAPALVAALKAEFGDRIYTSGARAPNLAATPLSEVAGKVVMMFDNDFTAQYSARDGVFPMVSCGDDSCVESGPGFGVAIYNEYSDSNSVERMRRDQFAKFELFGSGACGAPGKRLFLLSWTLTSQATDLVFDIAAIAPSANARLAEAMSAIAARQPGRTPQIVFYDFVDPHLDNLIIGLNKMRC